MESCYMCERPATSKEHVPPRCLFPESKDMGGESHRRNLITVPSCDVHNSGKSRDDEFLMVSLAGIVGNNSIGYRHKFGKVNKAIRRSAGRLLEEVFLKKELFVVEVKENKFFSVIWGTPDAERLNRCLEYIARGLHIHHFGERFDGTLRIHLGYLNPKDQNSKSFNEFVRRKFEMELEGASIFGDNNKVFFYQVTKTVQHGLYAMRLCFYGGINIYVSFVPNGKIIPRNLTWELVSMGVQTEVTLGDESFTFNCDSGRG